MGKNTKHDLNKLLSYNLMENLMMEIKMIMVKLEVGIKDKKKKLNKEKKRKKKKNYIYY